jgi:6-phosphofructokinase 2
MASILTLTFNPTIDVSTSVACVEPEHKLRCGPSRRDPGGGGINVARVVSRLGGDVVAIYATGGRIGALLRALTDAEGVASRTVPIAEETRESFTVEDEASGEQYSFVLPGPRLSDAEWRTCLDAVTSFAGRIAFIVASGSLPPGVPRDVLGALAKIAKDRAAKLVVDGGAPVLAGALEAGVHLIKPNLREMRELMGEPLRSTAEWIAAARRLVASGNVERVALTLGEHGALLVTADEAWSAAAPQVAIVSAVGAGDSFLGAMVWALSRGHSHRDALRHATAAGTAALLTPATELCRKEDVERLLAQVKIEAI